MRSHQEDIGAMTVARLTASSLDSHNLNICLAWACRFDVGDIEFWINFTVVMATESGQWGVPMSSISGVLEGILEQRWKAFQMKSIWSSPNQSHYL